MAKSRQVHDLYIRTTPEALWSAITDPEQTRRYWYGALNRSEWKASAGWTSESEDGHVYLDGRIVEIDPPRRLVQTFHVLDDPEAAEEEPSRLTFEIEQMGSACRLLLTHEELGPATEGYIEGGWATILSGLKTLLETGEELRIGEPD